jgi:hypothetical protein
LPNAVCFGSEAFAKDRPQILSVAMNRQNALRSMAENVVHHGKNRVMQQVCLGMGFRKCHRFFVLPRFIHHV